MKSRYSFPSTSVIVQPAARSTTICEYRAIDCSPGAIASASRSKIALDLGPGTARRCARSWGPDAILRGGALFMDQLLEVTMRGRRWNRSVRWSAIACAARSRYRDRAAQAIADPLTERSQRSPRL